jgi:hypothetical protein
MTTHQLPTTGTISGVAEQGLINAALAVLATMAQGPPAPTTTSTGLSSLGGIWWHNTSNGQISVRNQADSAWVLVGTINETAGLFTPAGVLPGSTYLPLAGGTLTGTLTISIGGVVVSAGGISVAAGGASITGTVSITGNSTVTGTLHATGNATFDAGVSVGGQIVAGASGIKFSDSTVMTTVPNLSPYALTTSLSAYALSTSLGNFAGVVNVSAAATLTQAQTGNLINIGGSGAYTLTLPSPSVVGSVLRFFAGASVGSTVVLSGNINGSATTSFTVNAGYGGQTTLVATGSTWLALANVVGASTDTGGSSGGGGP